MERRIYLKELAEFLNHDRAVVWKYARSRGLVRRGYVGHGRRPVFWVTEATASRIIAYVRAIQGAAYMDGKNFLEQKAKHVIQQRRHLAAVRNLSVVGRGKAP